MKKIIWLIAALLCCSIMPVNAKIFSYITKAAGTPTGVNYVYYDYVISSWSTEEDSQPNPCYGYAYCWLHVNHRHTAAGTGGSADPAYGQLNIGAAKTIGDVRKLWIAAHPMPNTGQTRHQGDVLTEECVGLFYVAKDIAAVYDTDPRILFPGSVCGLAPPPVGSCKLDGDITLDYGSVSAASLNGKVISKTSSVTCSKDMAIQLWLFNPSDDSDQVPLRSDNSIVAKLTLNGDSATAGKTINVTSGVATPFTVSSEALVSGSPEAGAFSGSAILLLAIP